MTHICVSKLTIIGSDNGLSPDRRQAIIWTNAGLLLIGPLLYILTCTYLPDMHTEVFKNAYFIRTIGLHILKSIRWASTQRVCTVYPKKYAHGYCFAVLCCGYTLTDFPISIRLTSLALWQSNDCPSASKATLMNMDKYFMWIHYERLRKHNKAKHNKTVCIFLGIYCIQMICTNW